MSEDPLVVLQNQVNDLTVALAAKTEAYNKLASDFQGLQQQRDGLALDKTNLETQVTGLQTKNNDLTANLALLQQERDNLALAKTNLETQVTGLQQGIQTISNEKADIQTSLTNSTAAYHQLAGVLSEVLEEKAAVENQYAVADQDRRQFQLTINDLKKQLQDLQVLFDKSQADNKIIVVERDTAIASMNAAYQALGGITLTKLGELFASFLQKENQKPPIPPVVPVPVVPPTPAPVTLTPEEEDSFPEIVSAKAWLASAIGDDEKQKAKERLAFLIKRRILMKT